MVEAVCFHPSFQHMGEVVDMTGRVVVADEHPLGADSVEHVSFENRHQFGLRPTCRFELGGFTHI